MGRLEREVGNPFLPALPIGRFLGFLFRLASSFFGITFVLRFDLCGFLGRRRAQVAVFIGNKVFRKGAALRPLFLQPLVGAFRRLRRFRCLRPGCGG
ncbi:MAG: hypothetical protein M2R45_03575 [Verrucomicrobia subdivision 3 bacterium]|nr:hypothetical protein [Limisphaerales bacterium]